MIMGLFDRLYIDTYWVGHFVKLENIGHGGMAAARPQEKAETAVISGSEDDNRAEEKQCH